MMSMAATVSIGTPLVFRKRPSLVWGLSTYTCRIASRLKGKCFKHGALKSKQGAYNHITDQRAEQLAIFPQTPTDFTVFLNTIVFCVFPVSTGFCAVYKEFVWGKHVGLVDIRGLAQRHQWMFKSYTGNVSLLFKISKSHSFIELNWNRTLTKKDVTLPVKGTYKHWLKPSNVGIKHAG